MVRKKLSRFRETLVAVAGFISGFLPMSMSARAEEPVLDLYLHPPAAASPLNQYPVPTDANPSRNMHLFLAREPPKPETPGVAVPSSKKEEREIELKYAGERCDLYDAVPEIRRLRERKEAEKAVERLGGRGSLEVRVGGFQYRGALDCVGELVLATFARNPNDSQGDIYLVGEHGGKEYGQSVTPTPTAEVGEIACFVGKDVYLAEDVSGRNRTGLANHIIVYKPDEDGNYKPAKPFKLPKNFYGVKDMFYDSGRKKLLVDLMYNINENGMKTGTFVLEDNELHLLKPRAEYKGEKK
jgi:hypothetical protein